MGTGRFAVASEGVAAPALTGNPTLLAHWDFDAASTITLSGADIDSIATRAGGTHTLLTPGAMPSQEARGGKNCARFTRASSEYMQIASAAGVNPTNGVTMCWVAEVVDAPTSKLFFDIADGAGGVAVNRYYLGVFNSTGWRARKAAASEASANEGAALAAAKYCVVARFTGGTGVCTLHVNGVAAGVASGSIGAPSGLSHTTLGALRDTGTETSFFDGYVWAGLLYEGDIGATAAEELAAWAATNYGTTNAA